MPDVDMDFADDRRDEVISYCIERYGRERVAQMVTFGRLLARAALRDVSRVLSYPISEVDRVAGCTRHLVDEEDVADRHLFLASASANETGTRSAGTLRSARSSGT